MNGIGFNLSYLGGNTESVDIYNQHNGYYGGISPRLRYGA